METSKNGVVTVIRCTDLRVCVCGGVQFLVDGSTGQVVKRYGTTTAPMSFEKDIVALLKK